MYSYGVRSFKWFFLALVGFSMLIPGAARADLESFDADLGRFAAWDSEVGTLSAVQSGAAGNTGGGMILSNGGATTIGVENYTVLPNTLYMVTAWIQVQIGGTDPFAFSVAVKSGNWDASNLDTSPGTWFFPGAWEYGADPTNDSQWAETENGWKIVGMSVLTGPSDAVLSLGFALTGAGAPPVYVDDVHVTQPSAALAYRFDEVGYIAFDDTTYGYHYDGTQSPAVTLNGVIPSTPVGIYLYVPTWMGGGVGDGWTTGSRETSTTYSGAAWRMEHSGGTPRGFDDASPVLPLATTPGTIYTGSFWMVRDRSSGGNAWVNWDDTYETHVAWRLADARGPGDIEGWQSLGTPGAIRPNAFHLICEGAANSERNYAPDIYAPGSGTTIDCVDPTGSRYSTMAHQAEGTTSWFEACIRGMRGESFAGPPSSGTSFWILDDFRLLVHGEEDLLALLVSGVERNTLEIYE